MNQSRPLYSVLVLFGKETKCSVATRDNFVYLTEKIAGLLAEAGCRITVRGTIDGAMGKNVAPRRGVWSPALRDKLAASLSAGNLQYVHLFDARWSGDREPDVFGAIHRLEDLILAGTDTDLKNHITIAFREDVVTGAFERLRGAAQELLERIAGFYGTIESGVPWDQPVGGMFEDMIDLRYHNRGDNDYRNGEYRMEKMVPRLYRANILCRTQFTNYDLDHLGALPGVAAVEKWPLGLTYLELKKQPAYGAKPAPRFSHFIRFVPDEAE